LTSGNVLDLLPVSRREPIVLPRIVEEEMRGVVEGVMDVLGRQSSRRMAMEFFQDDDVSHRLLRSCGDTWKLRGRMASFDFHVRGATPQLIECSVFPAGMSFVAEELLEPDAAANYRDAMKALWQTFDVIAICDRDLREQAFLAEFMWLKDRLESQGKSVYITEASDVIWSEGEGTIKVRGELVDKDGDLQYKPLTDPVPVDCVANRLPFGDLREDPVRFENLVAAHRAKPEGFLTDYCEWLLSEKSSLVFLGKEPYLAPFLGNASFSSEYLTVEDVRKKYRQKLVVKPLFSRGGEGVLVKPSNPQLKTVLEGGRLFVFQDYVPAPKLPDGSKFDIRALLIEGEISGFIARVFTGAVTNFRAQGSGHSPVVFR